MFEPIKDSSAKLSATLTATIEAIEGDTVTMRELIHRIGEQGMLLACALLTLPFMLPVSIPGVSTVFGAGIILISFGIAFNRFPWLPVRVLDRKIAAKDLLPTLRRGTVIIEKMEKYVRPRLSALTADSVSNRVNGLLMVFAGALLMLPLGIIPFSNTLPALAVLLFAIGMMQRDGFAIIAGFVMMVFTLTYFGILAHTAVSAGSGLVGFFS